MGRRVFPTACPPGMRPPVRLPRRIVETALALAALGTAGAVLYAQSVELPPEARRALEQVEDFSLSFSNPGFYAVLEHVKRMEAAPGHVREPIQIEDWTALMERPDDFRGLPITVEGVVGRNKAWRFEQQERQELGTVWQLELWRAGQPISVTAILTENADDIPLEATIRVSGYFVMMRQYPSGPSGLRQAALIVGQGPTLISQTGRAQDPRRVSKVVLGIVAAVTLALLVVWILLRRSVRARQSTEMLLHSSGPAPVSLAKDLEAWVAEDMPESLISKSGRKSDDN